MTASPTLNTNSVATIDITVTNSSVAEFDADAKLKDLPVLPVDEEATDDENTVLLLRPVEEEKPICLKPVDEELLTAVLAVPSNGS